MHSPHLLDSVSKAHPRNLGVSNITTRGIAQSLEISLTPNICNSKTISVNSDARLSVSTANAYNAFLVQFDVYSIIYFWFEVLWYLHSANTVFIDVTQTGTSK